MDKAMHSEFEGHYPAPWTFDTITGEPDGEQDTVIEHSGCPICTVRGTDDMSCIDEEDVEKIAKQCLANARLIAAAPDLLKENQSLRSELQKQKEEIKSQRYDLFHITAERDTLSAELAKQRQMSVTKSSLIQEFNTIIEAIENRCMATDGPVTPTLQEASEDELSRLWQLIQGIKKEYERLLMALVTRDGELTHKSMYAELAKQKELNAELVEALEWVENDVKVLSKVTDKTYDLVESLIKKSKES